VLTCTASPILAEPTRGGTLKFVTANALKVLDPFWTTAYISRNHGYMTYDVLFAEESASRRGMEYVLDLVDFR
jgi:peptide/nickel transport system substrate-binding protein